MTPDNVDLEDENVWRSIVDDTTLIFQFESKSAHKYLKKFMSEETLSVAKSKIPNFSTIKWLSFGNGLIRPACASFRDDVANGIFYDNGFEALNNFLAPEAGRIAMQETIMKFLVKFCGYSDAESDTVRRAIAKKKGTETLLPEIESRFIEYSSTHYDITKEECEKVIKPFIQIILDASAYGFSWNHSDSYSCIGYISGYLRYYYPGEFLTASLNIFDDDLDKTAQIIRYANKNDIKVVSPKWGISQSKYSYDKESGIIAKGLNSVKFMNAEVADELYKLSKTRKIERFVDVLLGMRDTKINKTHIETLIKIGFFDEFGNQRELLRIYDLYLNTFKRGDAKQVSRKKVEGTPLEAIVEKYSVGTTKSGGIAKSYTLLDVVSILQEAESAILESGMSDLDDCTKVKNYADVMGYVGYVSGKQEDRKKLYILEMWDAKRRRDGRVFGKTIITKSIGSGIESRATIMLRDFEKCEVKKGDIISCDRYIRENGYFTITSYRKLG